MHILTSVWVLLLTPNAGQNMVYSRFLNKKGKKVKNKDFFLGINTSFRVFISKIGPTSVWVSISFKEEKLLKQKKMMT